MDLSFVRINDPGLVIGWSAGEEVVEAVRIMKRSSFPLPIHESGSLQKERCNQRHKYIRLFLSYKDLYIHLISRFLASRMCFRINFSALSGLLSLMASRIFRCSLFEAGI